MCAVNVMGKIPPVVGVPLSTPVAVLNVTPPGNGPDSESDGAGKPTATTVKVPAVPTVNVAELPPVMRAA